MKKKRKLLSILIGVVFLELLFTSVFFLWSQHREKTSAIVPLPSSVSKLHLQQQEYKNIQNDLRKLVQEKDPHVALEKFKIESEKRPEVMASCHELLHDLGAVSYLKYKDFSKALSYRDEVCVSAYTHGVIEAYFTSDKHALMTYTQVCTKYQVDSFDRWQCVHGVGHGLMYYTGNNLPVSQQKCDQFISVFEQDACYSGVYMENFNADTSLHPSRFVSLSDPFSPCKISSKYLDECYMLAPIYYLNQRKDDFAGALRWCDTAPLLYQQKCFEGVGSQMTRRYFTKPKEVEEICMSQGKQKTASCINGMIKWYKEYDTTMDYGITVCDILEPANKQVCGM